MLVDFIIPTYDRRHELKSMLYSLIAQTNPDWNAQVIVDNPDASIDRVEDYRITYSFTDKRYNDWGHTPREIGKQRSKGDYIVMTGDDNYYIPTFVEELRKASANKPGMIYWDMVHSHYDYSYFKCQPYLNQIDMGAFATRNDLAKKIKLGTSYAADGYFVNDFKTMFPKEETLKIGKVLFVHN